MLTKEMEAADRLHGTILRCSIAALLIPVLASAV
jgi:hypothetical protein